jgi:transposase
VTDTPAARPAIRTATFALPTLLSEIARATNQEVALIVARTFGGRQLYIPRTARADHALALAVGFDAAATIGARWGAQAHHVPSAKPYLNWLDVHRLRDEGKSTAEISAIVKLGQRHVERLLEGHKALASKPKCRPGRLPRPIREAERIEELLQEGRSTNGIAREVGVSHHTVQRVKRQLAGAAAVAIEKESA